LLLQDVYQRERDGWRFDWTYQQVFINVDFTLVLDALLKMLSQLPQYAILCVPEWSSLHAIKFLHAPDADWVRLHVTDLEHDSPYFDFFIVSFDIPGTRALLLE
jgi:hypothetical protein